MQTAWARRVNISLGYFEFDDPAMNFTYNDMNGKLSRASRAATLAAQRNHHMYSAEMKVIHHGNTSQVRLTLKEYFLLVLLMSDTCLFLPVPVQTDASSRTCAVAWVLL